MVGRILLKGRVYVSCVRSNMTYGSETRPLLVDVGLKFERAEMQMIRWMCGISIKDRRTNVELRRLAGVEPITTVIRSGRLRWYGHVMRKGDEDCAKKCMEYRVEGRRPVGRPRKTLLESVEADMAELEIYKEDVHYRQKWRRNVMKRKSNYIRRRNINRKQLSIATACFSFFISMFNCRFLYAILCFMLILCNMNYF